MDLIHTLFEPAGEGPHPTIIALHGWGATRSICRASRRISRAASSWSICPQGPLEVPIGAVSGYGWFPIRMGTPPREDQIDEAVDRAAKFIDAAIARYPVQSAQAGDARLQSRRCDGVSARLPASGEIRRAGRAIDGVPTRVEGSIANRDAIEKLPTLIQHGRADEMIPLSRAKESVEHLRELQVPVTFKRVRLRSRDNRFEHRGPVGISHQEGAVTDAAIVLAGKWVATASRWGSGAPPLPFRGETWLLLRGRRRHGIGALRAS